MRFIKFDTSAAAQCEHEENDRNLGIPGLN